jgi:hypothetical protein
VLLCLVEAQSATRTFPAAAASRIPFFFLPWRMMDGLHFQVPTSSPTHQKHTASKQIKLVFLSSSFLLFSLSLSLSLSLYSPMDGFHFKPSTPHHSSPHIYRHTKSLKQNTNPTHNTHPDQEQSQKCTQHSAAKHQP